MRKGLITLITVATLVISLQAQAMAPVIGDIPSPIVGNKVSASQPTAYTFPDALDLNLLATDDNTAADQLKWSYEIIGTQKFAINGDAPINSGSENVILPPAAKTINTQWNGIANSDANDDPNPDTKVNTITIRNIQLFPWGGPASSDNSAAAQNWANNMQAVTFWCSDGNLATSKTVMFYTDNTYTGTTPSGYSRLSGSQQVWTKMKEWTGTVSWHMYDTFLDKCTSGTLNGKGVCFNVATTGQNFGSVATGAQYVTLTDNLVYRIRATMNSNQLTAGKTPFWDFILENWSNLDPTKGINLYGFDSFYLDNEKGANTIVSKAQGTEVMMYWAPIAFQTAQWKSTTNGIFAANAAPGADYRDVKDAQLRYRVMDVDSNAALGNNTKSGQICLMSCIVETCPATRKVYTSGSAAIPPTADKYALTTGMKAAHDKPATGPGSDPVPGNLITTSLTGATISYSGGVLTITPTGTSRQNDLVTILPATDLKTPATHWGSWADLDDDYPIAWESNKLYELEVKLSAPTSNDAASPWDVLWLNLEPPTNELIAESYVTAKNNIAMPKTSTSGGQAYYLYYWSGLETISDTPALHFLRWRIRFANSTNLNWPSNSDVMNTGAVRVHSIKVNTVDFR